MAISTDARIDFFGNQDTLGTTSAAVAIGAFSLATDLSTWVNDDDVREASVTLAITFASAPDANSSIPLFLRLLDIEGTNDQEVPSATFQHVYVNSFPVNNVTSAQRISIDISLPNMKTSQNYEYYLQNLTGQIMPAGWDVFPTPKTDGPHA